MATSVHHGMDRSMDAGVDGRWLTYAELAEIRRIDKTSALKLAIRHKWTRQRNNRGQMQVLVPIEWAQPPERFRDTATDGGVDGGVDLSTALAAYEDAKTAFVTALTAKDGEIAGLRDQVEHERGRADRAEKRADVAAVLAERTLSQLADANIRADQAEAAAEQLRQADEARKARGRLRRAWDGWRGR